MNVFGNFYFTLMEFLLNDLDTVFFSLSLPPISALPFNFLVTSSPSLFLSPSSLIFFLHTNFSLIPPDLSSLPLPPFNALYPIFLLPPLPTYLSLPFLSPPPSYFLSLTAFLSPTSFPFLMLFPSSYFSLPLQFLFLWEQKQCDINVLVVRSSYIEGKRQLPIQLPTVL